MHYIDPGAASLIIQGLIAAVVGVGAFFKLYWRKVRALTGGGRGAGSMH